jgi:hypothetical protein
MPSVRLTQRDLSVIRALVVGGRIALDVTRIIGSMELSEPSLVTSQIDSSMGEVWSPTPLGLSLSNLRLRVARSRPGPLPGGPTRRTTERPRPRNPSSWAGALKL